MRVRMFFTAAVTASAAVFFAGCGGGSEKEVKARVPIVTPAGTYPIVEEPIILRIAVPQDPKIENLETNELTLEYEELTGIKVEWEILPQGGDALEQKKNLLLAARADLPDVFLNAEILNVKQTVYGMDQGVFISLSDLIDEYAPNIKAMIDHRPEIRKMVTAPDGNIYAVPAISEGYHLQTPVRLWMNGAWLDKLGLEIPETLDEMYTVLKAFKDRDPNGNGIADEVPLTGAVTGWGTRIVDYFMLPHVYSLSENKERWAIEDGRVFSPYVDEGWREGLRYLNRLYNDGLLDPAAFTQNVNQLRALTENPDAWIVGAATAGAPGGMSNSNSDRSKQYVAVGPLTGPQGVRRSAYKPFAYNLGKFVITQACEYPEAAIRWVDWFASRDGSLRARNGVENRDWRWAESGELGVNRQQGVYARILKFGKVQNVHWNKNVPDFYPDELRNGMVSDENDPEAYLYRITKELYIDHIPEEVMLPFFMTAEESEEYDELRYLINQYGEETYARFIIGDLDINSDDDWNSYLAEMENLGLERYTEIARKGYTAQYK